MCRKSTEETGLHDYQRQDEEGDEGPDTEPESKPEGLPCGDEDPVQEQPDHVLSRLSERLDRGDASDDFPC